MFVAALFTITRIWKQPKCLLMDEWIKKIHSHTHTHTHTHEYYSAMVKKEILSSVTAEMDLEDIILSEISQTEKDKYCIILLICGI